MMVIASSLPLVASTSGTVAPRFTRHFNVFCVPPASAIAGADAVAVGTAARGDR